LVAVSTESSEDQAALAAKLGLTFKILSDADRALTGALGLRHAGGNPMDAGDIARPAVLIVTGGVIRTRYATDNWRVRQDGAALVAELSKLP
jgi:peroxiredoxin